MATNQAHEQDNAVITADGGAIGITEDPSALRRWMVAGPEVSHLVAQHEAASKAKETSEHASHHEQTQQAQKVFLERVKRLSHVMTDTGNPFQEDSQGLLSLDTKDIAHASTAELIVTHYEKGRARFLEENGRRWRIHLLWTDQEKVKLFFPPGTSLCWLFEGEGHEESLPTLLWIVHLMSEQRIWSQGIFRHENHPFPAALSDSGKLKSQLAAILENLVKIPDMEPVADTWIFVHARQGGDEGCRSILIKANDTDVLIIVVSVLLTLQEVGLQELWIACGQGWNLRWIPIHELFFLYWIAEEQRNSLPPCLHWLRCCVIRGKGKGRNTLAQPLDVWSVWGDSDDVGNKYVWCVQLCWKLEVWHVGGAEYCVRFVFSMHPVPSFPVFM